jgi:soluble lytic murein transglycosylase-like protein
MRRSQSATAWPIIKTLDPAKAHFEPSAYAYALWVKGMVAWISKDGGAAYKNFAELTNSKDIGGPNMAAANFWAARAADRLGKKEDATRFMNAAARYPRSFYGVLAISHNNASPEYNWTMPGFAAGHADKLKQTAAGRRALALLQLDERALAEAELRNIPDSGMSDSVLALANRYGLPSLAMQIGSGISGRRYDAALYPLMPWQPAGGYASDPALVLSIAKNESRFNHTALSPAGAKGVMQVMPRTAEVVKSGSSKNLYDPEVSVTLGDRYLEMLTRTEGVKNNLLLIIGSYNCGPETLVRLQQTSMKQNGDDPLLFIETLPIKETRDYMQKVMATYWVYRARFNKPLTAMAELAIGRWPQYRPNEAKMSASAASY